MFTLAVEEYEITYDSLFALMASTEDEEENEVTLSDIKKNLDNYSTRKIKDLTTVLIDSV